MCGIVGIFRPSGWSEPAPVYSLLESAGRSIAYRGPDASGTTVLDEHGVGFGHRRLAILDLDARANQPMASRDGKALVTFNGEIYNFRELRAELAARGVSFRTESDTEVLAEGYRAWGLPELLRRAAGMFALGLYDLELRRLFLARDRAGKKPLLYYESPEGLAFASELRALLILEPRARALDPEGLDAYLALKFTPSPRSLLAGVRRLPPAHYLESDGRGAPRLERYWRPWGSGAGDGGPADSRSWRERIATAFDAAVKRRLVSDVPICVFLSGGVDSGLMADSLARAGADGLKTYTIGYKDLPEYNEFEYSRKVASRLPLRYEEVLLESGEARELLQDEALVLDEPLSDWVWVPLYQLSRKAHGDGFKVVLVGEGSDEIFFGYDVMQKGLANLSRFARPSWRVLAKAASASLAPVYRRARRGHGRYDLLRRVAEGLPVYMGSSIGFGRSQRHQVAGPRLLREGDGRAGERFVASLYRGYADHAPDPADLANLVCFVEFHSKMTEVLLQRVDRVTMLQSLEARSPFLDHELVELAFALPGELKLPEGRLKGFLKDFARSRLPPEVVDRKKMGFSFPFKEWLRGDLGGLVERCFKNSALFSDGWVNGGLAGALLREHRSGLADHAPRVWMLFSLCRWYDRWVAQK